MIKFNKTFVDNNQYPITVTKYLQNLCSQIGIELGSKTLANENYQILGNPFNNNEDCRTVLSNVAQLCGGFAKIGRNNKLYIYNLCTILSDVTVEYVDKLSVNDLNLMQLDKTIQNSKDKIDANNYFTDFAKNNVWGEINSLVIRLSNVEGENNSIEDKQSIEKNGLTEIVIEDNAFLSNQEQRLLIIQPLWNILHGIKYLPFTTEYYGYPYLDSGDLIQIYDTSDNEYYTYIFNHTFIYNGSFKGKIETKALSKTQTSYKNTNDIKTKFKNVELAVDKINGNITAIVEKQDETTDTMEKIQIDLTGVTNTLQTTGGNNQLYYLKEFWTAEEENSSPNLEQYIDTEIKNNSISGLGYILNNGVSKQIVQLQNGTYTISFKYKKLIELANCKVIINEIEYPLEQMNWTEFEQTIDISDNQIIIKFMTDTEKSCYLTDLLANKGNTKETWSQNPNETITDTVYIGKGITVKSSTTNTELQADSDGIRINSINTNKTVAEFTDKGTETEDLVVKGQAQMSGLLIQETGNQTWISSLL